MIDDPCLLTAEEHDAVDHLGAAARILARITNPTGRHGGAGDWAEAAAAIHALQNMILRQAAARAYPDRYRPLGGWPQSLWDDRAERGFG